MSINKFGYQNLPIYKVNYYINKNEYIKYIFVGERDKNIKNILSKLEKGYNNITNSESNILDKEILNYKKIFGDIIPEQCKFIYSYISNFTNITNLLIKINYFIDKDSKELLPQNQYLWVKYSNFDYQKFIDINKYVSNFSFSFINNYLVFRSGINRFNIIKLFII